MTSGRSSTSRIVSVYVVAATVGQTASVRFARGRSRSWQCCAEGFEYLCVPTARRGDGADVSVYLRTHDRTMASPARLRSAARAVVERELNPSGKDDQRIVELGRPRIFLRPVSTCVYIRKTQRIVRRP